MFFCEKFCGWGNAGKLEFTRDAVKGKVLQVNAIGKIVWQKVYFAPHPVFG